MILKLKVEKKEQEHIQLKQNVKTDGTDKWEAPFYQNGLITGHTRDGEVVNTKGNIGTITFKVKSDAKLGESIISLKNFSGSTAVTDVDAANVPVTKITVIDNIKDEPDDPTDGSDKDNPNGGSSNGSNSSNGGSSNGNSSSNNKDNTIKQDKLPKTGEADIVIYMAIGAGLVLATIFFVKMKKFNIQLIDSSYNTKRQKLEKTNFYLFVQEKLMQGHRLWEYL